MREGVINRKTNETDIRLKLELDGSGKSCIDTGCGFLDHMLTLFARHGRFDLTVSCKGDTEVDYHHTTEDIGIALGDAFAAALGDLNAITHRYVRAEVRARLRAWARQGGTVAAIDAIALIESGLAELCTVTLGVTAPRAVRIERLIAREGVTRDYAEARIDAQKPNEWFAKHCSYVLDNGGTLADFQRRCHQLIQEVLS